MASVSEIKAKIAKKREFLKQVPIVRKEIKELEVQLKAAEVDELTKVLSKGGIDIEALKRAVTEGNIVLPDKSN